MKVDYQKLEALEMDEFEEVVNEFQSVMSFEDEKKEAILSGKFAEANKEIITAFEVSSHETAVCGKTMSVKGDKDKEIHFFYVACTLVYKLSKRKTLLNMVLGPFGMDTPRPIGEDDEEEVMKHVRKKCNEAWKTEHPNVAKTSKYEPNTIRKD